MGQTPPPTLILNPIPHWPQFHNPIQIKFLFSVARRQSLNPPPINPSPSPRTMGRGWPWPKVWASLTNAHMTLVPLPSVRSFAHFRRPFICPSRGEHETGSSEKFCLPLASPPNDCAIVVGLAAAAAAAIEKEEEVNHKMFQRKEEEEEVCLPIINFAHTNTNTDYKQLTFWPSL